MQQIILNCSAVFYKQHIFLVISIVLFLLLAFISGAKVSFLLLKSNFINLLKEKAKHNKLINNLQNPQMLISTIIISKTILSFLFIYSLLQLISTISINGIILFLLIVPFVFLLAIEIIPKIIANIAPERYSIAIFPLIISLKFIFYPFIVILNKISDKIEYKFHSKISEISIEDLSEALENQSNIGEDENNERKILKGIVKFGEIEVKEIMKSRYDISAIDKSSSFNELYTFILQSGYSRVPVYSENLDTIIGIIYIKDLLKHLNEKSDFEWNKLVRQAFFVSENTFINDLLKEFRKRKIHLAIVADEYGGTSGLITLEDILEEIVGEINDEFDDDDLEFNKIDNNNYIFEGRTLINDFCKILNLDNELFENAKGNSDTLAGLILELAGKIPDLNDSYCVGKYIFQPYQVDKRSIKKVKVVINENEKE